MFRTLAEICSHLEGSGSKCMLTMAFANGKGINNRRGKQGKENYPIQAQHDHFVPVSYSLLSFSSSFVVSLAFSRHRHGLDPGFSEPANQKPALRQLRQSHQSKESSRVSRTREYNNRESADCGLRR
jgi:hypothetical protein